jgi:hypothetical protein
MIAGEQPRYSLFLKVAIDPLSGLHQPFQRLVSMRQ